MRTINACPDDENNDFVDEEENDCLLVKIEESDKIKSLEQINNQKRIKLEIKEYFLSALGGWPTTIDNKPVSYEGVSVSKLWGNRYRVNLKVKDKYGNVKYPHSCFIHYQKNHIMEDKLTQITKIYSNYKEEKIDS